MSEQTKIGGKTSDKWRDDFCVERFVDAAFGQVAELEAERDALKAEVERLRLPYVMRDEPPDREGLWMYDSGKFGSVGVTRIYQGGSGLRTSLGEDPAKLDCLWGSAPLPVGEVEG